MNSSPKEQERRDVLVFNLAVEYLLSFPKVTPKLLDEYGSAPWNEGSRDSLARIYEGMLWSAQNAQGMPNSISGALGGIAPLRKVLCGFRPAAVVREYGDDDRKFLDAVKRRFPVVREMRLTKRSYWPRFCRAALSSARFLQRFQDGRDFCAWVAVFDRDDRARGALPLLIAAQVDGFGFALACDFLKELGFHDFSKPDVHLKRIFRELELAPDDSDYAVFTAIARVARSVRKTPYYVDKMFWLVGSGNFYNHDLTIGKHDEEFIKLAKRKLAVQ
jgi:hypothetical protein